MDRQILEFLHIPEFVNETADSILELSATDGVVDIDAALFVAQSVFTVVVHELSQAGAFDCKCGDSDDHSDTSEKVFH